MIPNMIKRKMSARKNILISVIIRTYNEEKSIRKCLKSVFNQKINIPFEVIIVDSESTDKTLKIVSEFKVKIIKMKKKDFTFGRSLNIGCKATKGKYLVLLSAHAIIIGSNWLKTMIDNFKDPLVAGVYGKELANKDCNPITRRNRENWKDIRKVEFNNPKFCNPGSVILKSIWEKVPFDENLIAAEDYDWAKKVQKLGFCIVYEPKAKIMHSHNETIKQIYKRFYREKYSTRKIEKNIIKLRYFADPFYDFFQDFLYIIRNKESIYWIFRSFIINFILLLTAGLILLNRVYDKVVEFLKNT